MNFTDIITSAPWWMWGALIFFVDIGLRSLHQHSVYIPKLFLIPIILVILKFKDIFSSSLSAAVTLMFLLIGSFIGTFFASRSVVSFNKEEWTVKIPGSCVTFAFLMAFFVFKFLFSYLEANNPEAMQNYFLIDMIISALFSGYFLGRACFFSYKFYKQT